MTHFKFLLYLNANVKKKQNKKTAACYVARVCALCDPTKCTHFTVDLICRKNKTTQKNEGNPEQREHNQHNGMETQKKRSQTQCTNVMQNSKSGSKILTLLY